MKSYRRLLIFLVVAMAVAAILSPWAAAAWNSIVDSRAEWARYRYSFSQIFSGLFIITGTALVLSCRSLIQLRFLREAAILPLQQGGRNLLRGFAVAIGSVASLGLLMVIAKIFTPGFYHPVYDSLEWSGRALVTSLAVGFFEEMFFRGLVFKGLLEDTRPVTAFVTVNLFYAAVHFVKPPEEWASSGFDPSAGMRYLIQWLQPFLDPAKMFPGLVGLFIIGLVLSYALLRTQSLYLSIGLHAGWVFGLKTIRIYGEFQRADLGWAFGSSEPKIVSGVITWIGIAAVGIVVHMMTRKRS